MALGALILAAVLISRLGRESGCLPTDSLRKVSDIASKIVLWQADHSGKLPTTLSQVSQEQPLGDVSGVEYSLIDQSNNFRVTYFDKATNTLIVADQRGLILPVGERPAE